MELNEDRISNDVLLSQLSGGENQISAPMYYDAKSHNTIT